MKKIAVLMVGLIYDSQKKIIAGIKKAAEEKGCHVFVFTCSGDVFIKNEYSQGEFSIFSLPRFETFDGIILAVNTIRNDKTVEDIIQRISSSKTPTISIDNKIEGFAHIGSNNTQAMKNIVAHLINNHKLNRIAFLAGPKTNIESQHRLEGYTQAMEEAGISVDPSWIYHQDFTDRNGDMVASYFIDDIDEMPQAIVCANDLMAISTAYSLMQRNIQIPEQIAITGFDYTEDSIIFTPQITSVKRFQEETGYKALDHLYKVITNNEELIKSIEIETECVFSTSCGCPESLKLNEVDLKKNLFHFKSKTMHETYLLKTLYTKSISLNNHKDFYATLKIHFSNKFFNQFFLCIKSIKNEKYEKDYLFNDESILKVAFRRDYDLDNFENIVFPTKDIIPESILDSNIPMFYFVMAIHSIEHTIGYAVIDSDAPLNSGLFYSSILDIGMLHENIKNKIKLKTTVEQLDYLWIHDSLTRLYNRNGFMKHSKEIMNDCIKSNINLLVLFIDVDNLKSVNDNFGHYEGDIYLKSMANILFESKAKTRLVMRYGGDEFVVFSPNHTEKSAKEYIESIKSDIRILNQTVDKPYHMDMSIGYILKKIDKDDSPESLITLADKEMYIIKNMKNIK